MLEVEFSIFHCFQILDVIFGQKFAIFQKSSKVNCKQAIIFNPANGEWRLFAGSDFYFRRKYLSGKISKTFYFCIMEYSLHH